MATITQTATISIPRGPVTSEMIFFKPTDDGSAPCTYISREGVTHKNYGEERQQVTISDVRGQESRFTLDSHAFQVIQGINSKEVDFTEDEKIRRVYYPEVEKLILDHVPGAYRVFLFDHTVRRASPGSTRTPAYMVHIDQTPLAAANRVRLHLPDEADKLLQGRYRIINVWRPINGPVYASPLAVANGSTVRDEDLVPVAIKFPNREGETAGVKYHPKQEWHYLSGMTNNERLLLKCFDSDENVGKWGRVPHSAFKDPRTPAEAPGRESIEVRAFVFG